MKVLKVFIDGMTCAHCKAAVEKAIGSLPGVSAVEVDLNNKSAAVETDGSVEMKAIHQAVIESGYQPL